MVSRQLRTTQDMAMVSRQLRTTADILMVSRIMQDMDTASRLTIHMEAMATRILRTRRKTESDAELLL